MPDSSDSDSFADASTPARRPGVDHSAPFHWPKPPRSQKWQHAAHCLPHRPPAASPASMREWNTRSVLAYRPYPSPPRPPHPSAESSRSPPPQLLLFLKLPSRSPLLSQEKSPRRFQSAPSPPRPKPTPPALDAMRSPEFPQWSPPPVQRRRPASASVAIFQSRAIRVSWPPLRKCSAPR